MFYFTGIQHTTSGDTVMPVLGYETRDGYVRKYLQEKSYAMDNSDFIGLTVLVFDNTGAIVFSENWVREIPMASPNE